ncbi:MAG: hypothetical protein GX660_16950, partial [Clostridiaceae bacterium]|nr:hypothetical protein [Clostridiaceae bacterium]
MYKMKKSFLIIIVFIFLIQTLLANLALAQSDSLLNSENTSKVKATASFIDISNHWAEKFIKSLSSKGYLKGYAANDGYLAKPDTYITRAEFLTILLKTKKLVNVSSKEKVFKDVSVGDWYKETVDIASSNNIVEGYPDGFFKPDSHITRAEMSALIVRFNEWNNEVGLLNAGTFPDVKEGDWFYKPVIICKTKEIIKGFPDGTFRPGSFALRAEAFALLSNYIDKYCVEQNSDEIPGGPVVTSTPLNTPIPTSTPKKHSSGGGSSGKIEDIIPTEAPTIKGIDMVITYPSDIENENVFAEDENYKISGYFNRSDVKSLSYVVENDSGNGVKEKYLEDSVDLNKLDSDTIIFAIDSIDKDFAPWDIYLKLKPNKNCITITAADKNGNTVEKKLEILYEAETVIDETFTLKYYNICINEKEMKALPGGGYSLTLGWDSIYKEGTKYAILKETSDGNKDVVAKGLTDKSYTDTNVKPNERYKYTVQAEVEPGDFAYSNKLKVIFNPDSD